MSTSTPNTSLTTFGDITSDQNHLWPTFALSDDDNELNALRTAQKAIQAKIAELERQQMLAPHIEATPKARANFEMSTDEQNGIGIELVGNAVNEKVDELGRKFDQMAKEVKAMGTEVNAIKQSGDKIQKVEAEIGKLIEGFAELEKTVFELKESQKNGAKAIQQQHVDLKTVEIEIGSQSETENESQNDENVDPTKEKWQKVEKKCDEADNKAAQVKPERERVRLIRGTTVPPSRVGRAWYFVLVDPYKEELVLNNNGKSTNLRTYGKLLFVGWGKDPAECVIDEINARYGWNSAWRGGRPDA